MSDRFLPEYTAITPEQKDFFESNGYLQIKNALPPDVLDEVNDAIDEIYALEEKGAVWRREEN